MISVIMPTYNRANVIGRAIDSVLNQTYRDIELIIIDDGSTDNTMSVVSAYKDKRIRYFYYADNRGQSHARNFGLDVAVGEYVAFLDSDNEWSEDHLQGRIGLLKDVINPVISYSRIHMVADDHADYLFPEGLTDTEADDRKALIHKMCISNQIDTNGVIISRDCMEEFRFDEDMDALEDWDVFLRIIRDTEVSIIFDPRVTVKHYLMCDSISNQNDSFMMARINLFYKNIDLFDDVSFEEMDADIGFLMEGIETASSLSNLKDMPASLGRAAANYFAYIFYRMRIHHDHMWVRINELSSNEASYRHIVNIEETLTALNVRKIAIYGYGNFGKKLYQGIRHSGITVTDIIDRNHVISASDEAVVVSEIPQNCEADMIIVTVLKDGEAIAKDLSEKTDITVCTLAALGE